MRKSQLEGKRVLLIEMVDDYTNLKEGDLGTIKYVDDANTIHVLWDNGSTLGLIPSIDKYTILTLQEERRLKLNKLKNEI